MLFPQLSKMPEEYLLKLLPSTATETGLLIKALSRSVQVLGMEYPLILNSPLEALHEPRYPV
jgi:hypothetical protein